LVYPPQGAAVGITKLSELIIDADKDWATKNITNFGPAGIDLYGMVTSHASRHATGGADELPANSITTDMLNFATWEKIAEVTVAVNSDYVDFTGLDVNTDKFYVLYMALTNPTASESFYYLFVEGDYTLTNYYSQVLNVYGSSTGIERRNDPRVAIAPAGEGSFFEVVFTRDPNGYFRAVARGSWHTGSGIQFLQHGLCKTATVTNITSARLSASVTGAIGTGSKFILCKVRTK